MQLSQIFTIKNHPGLYKAESKTKNGFIASSLTDAKRVPVTDHSDDAFCLASINIYRIREAGEEELKEEQIKHIPLLQIFKTMHSHEHPPVDAKADVGIIKNYFFTLVPNIDQKRVFASDMKKIISWYNLLKDKVAFSTPVATDKASN